MLICDTSGLLAYVDRDALRNDAVTAALEADRGPRIVSPFVLAELDYMVMTRLGVQAELAVLSELLSGAWQLEGLDPAELRQAGALIRRYHDQRFGLADASLVVLAARHRTKRILTLDQRHFRVLRTLSDEAFEVLPG